MRVIRDAVLIKLAEEEITKSGIYIPTITDETLAKGEVLQLGEGIISAGKRVKPVLKVGDKILFRKIGIIPIKRAMDPVEMKPLHLISETCVMVIIERLPWYKRLFYRPNYCTSTPTE